MITEKSRRDILVGKIITLTTIGLIILGTMKCTLGDTVNTYIGINKEINDQLDIGVTLSKFSDRFDPEASSTKVGPYVRYEHNDNITVRYGIKSGSSTEYNVNFVSHNISVSIDL